jgi:hypothetical protein
MTTNIFLIFFVWFFIPETKSIALEEVDVLFGGANHTEKGGDILHVEDPHHAHIGQDNMQGDAIATSGTAHGHATEEIKMS